MIIVRCLKNYLKGLGYYFTPLGVITLCLLIAISIAVPHMIQVVKDAFDAVSKELGGVTYDWDAAKEFVMGQIFANDWSQAGTFLSPEWFKNVLQEAMKVTFHTEELIPAIQNIILNAIMEIQMDLIMIAVSFFIGFILGFIILRVQMRKRITEAGFIRVFLVSLFDAFIVGGLALLIYFIQEKSQAGGIVMIIIGTVIVLLGSIIEAYLFYGIKRAKLKQVFSPKSFLFLLIGDILVIGITIGVGFLCHLANMVIFITIFFPFVEIALCVLTINAEGMVMDFVRENKLEKKIEKRIEKVNQEQA